MTWLLDLDGVVWRGSEPIAGAAAAIAALKAAGHEVGYVTNNSTDKSVQVSKLEQMGVDAAPEDIVNGPDAVATLLTPGWKVLCFAVDGIRGPLEAKGIHVIMTNEVEGTSPPEVDAAVVAIRPEGTMRELNLALRAVLQSRRLFGPSADPLYPVEDGFDIGSGGLITAVATATGVEAVIAGKPFTPITNAVRERFGTVDMVVGDQKRSDGALADQLGVPFVLVGTGVTSPQGRSDTTAVPVAHEHESLEAAVAALL